MFRLKIALIIIGGFLTYFGVQEFRVSQSSSANPITVDLRDVEKGTSPTANNVNVTEHVALYPLMVYSYNKGKYDNSTVNDSTTISYAYYPIVSLDNSFVKDEAELIKKYGSVDKIPQDVPISKITNVQMLVKTRRFKTVGSIPKSMKTERNVTGLIINQIDGLKSDEENLLTQGLPDVDISNVLILEEGREPSSFIKWFGMSGGGILLCALGLIWMCMPGKKA